MRNSEIRDLLGKTIAAVEFPQSNVDNVLEEIKLIATLVSILELFTVEPFKLALPSGSHSSH